MKVIDPVIQKLAQNRLTVRVKQSFQTPEDRVNVALLSNPSLSLETGST